MDRVYISGPISYVRSAMMNFDKAQFALESRGYDVFNPFAIRMPDTEEEKKEYNKIGEWAWFMRRCISELAKCDAILMLPDWMSSRGARVERDLADDLKLTIYENLDEVKDINELRES